MAVHTLRGPYLLSRSKIESVVPPKSPGVFILGRLNTRGTLNRVEVLGRSDFDLAAELRDHARALVHQAFLFETASTALSAFEMECGLYHEFRLADFLHPERPRHTAWKCPVCKHYP